MPRVSLKINDPSLIRFSIDEKSGSLVKICYGKDSIAFVEKDKLQTLVAKMLESVVYYDENLSTHEANN